MLSAEQCFIFIYDEATSELVCQVSSSCDPVIPNSNVYTPFQVFDEEPLDKEIRKPVRISLSTFEVFVCVNLSSSCVCVVQ